MAALPFVRNPPQPPCGLDVYPRLLQSDVQRQSLALGETLSTPANLFQAAVPFISASNDQFLPILVKSDPSFDES